MKWAWCAFLFFLNIMPLTTFAYWPTFWAPDQKFLLDYGLIETSACPAGQGKLVENAVIEINQAGLCRLHCSSAWKWIGHGNDQCHSLAQDFNVQRIDITRHETPGEPPTLYSVVTAHYGAFIFTMTTEADNHWGCYEMNPELHIIACANDI
jgi:hypothetical protein